MDKGFQYELEFISSGVYSFTGSYYPDIYQSMTCGNCRNPQSAGVAVKNPPVKNFTRIVTAPNVDYGRDDLWVGIKIYTPPTPTPTPTPYCDCSAAWQNVLCDSSGVGWSCNLDEMHQVQFCTWSDTGGLCDTNHQCVVDASCVVSWFQTQGGDVHSQGRITSAMPGGNYFSLDLSGVPGVVSYRDSSSDPFGLGSVSSKGWLVKDSASANYSYNFFNSRINQDDGDPNLASKPANGVYKVSGDKTISQPWNVNANDSIIVLIDGRLTINNNVQVASRGFLALIVKNGITVANSVRRVQGVYLTDQIFNTGAGDRQLVGEGIFAAGGFSLGREPSDSNTPGEKFIYRPDLLLNAPEAIKSSQYTWREVVP